MRHFVDYLQSMPTAALRTLITQRPDAFYPIPPSRASLATRLSLPASVKRILTRSDAADIAALEKLGEAGAELNEVDATALGIAPENLESLRASALIFGANAAVRISPGTLSALPQGWRLTDTVPDDLEQRLQHIDAKQRRILETLSNAGGVGTTKNAAVDADPHSPIAQLIASGLLIRANETTVRLPRPVRDGLRGLRPRIIPTTPPPHHQPDQQRVDEHATGLGLDAVRKLRQLLLMLLRTPITLNKDGAVGVRALTQLNKTLNFDAALFITTGEAAGLIGRSHHDAHDVLAATSDALSWLDATQSAQWAILLSGWMASPWRTDQSEKHRLLAAETHHTELKNARVNIVRYAGTQHLERLLFHAPLQASNYSTQLIEATVEEACALGALAPDRPGAAPFPSTPLRRLLEDADITAATSALVPPEATYLIAQGDMTILAPGPLTPTMAATLESFATLESPGLASLWRVSEDSVRRGLNEGQTAEALHTWLAEHILGELPQALTYLIDDVARSHGSIRAGHALSYLHSADPALITTAAQHTQLRILAPTVAISQLPLETILRQLRAAGLQPTAEDATGATLHAAPEPVLAKATPSRLPKRHEVGEADVEKIIATLQQTEASAPTPADDAHDALETLKAAARARRHVTLGYVNKNGTGTTLTVLPLTISAGQVDVLDEVSERVVRIALARITDVVLT